MSSSASQEHLSYLNAALRALEHTKRPMSTREIVQEAIEQGWLAPSGKTPVASMDAVLYRYSRDKPTGQLVRMFEPGEQRAKRDSVRWSLRS